MDRKKEREEASFEAGIKLGALFHQFIGTPVSEENADILERAMESCMKLQPFVIDSEVTINRDKLRRAISEFGYTSLSGELLSAKVRVKVGKEEITAVLQWDDEKKYPLMRLVD